MRYHATLVATLGAIAAFLALPAVAQNTTPQVIEVQGFLSDKSGGTSAPVSGSFAMTFDLYDAEAEGLLIASAGPLSVDVTEGLYEVGLPFPTSVFDGADRYIEITVGGETLSPRIRVVSAPFAYVADQLDGFEGTELEESAEIEAIATTLQSEVADLQGQIDSFVAISGNTLDDAYDEGGPGAGRAVTADAGPVIVSGNDPLNDGLFRVEGALLIDSGATDGPRLVMRGGDGGSDEYRSRVYVDGALSFFPGELNQYALTLSHTSNVYMGLPVPSKSGQDYGRLTIFDAATPLAFEETGETGPGAVWRMPLDERKLRFDAILDEPGQYKTTLVMSADGVVHIPHRTVTGVLEITGGADLAEPFEVLDLSDVPKGTVLVIDETHAGKLKVADQPYDTRVAGIASGAGGIEPGLTLSQEGMTEGELNVAMAGRVYARATASNGQIRPGDLLTTSNTPGHAMKATNMRRASGATIGKAMSSLESGRGLVLVLVNLQ